MLPAPVHAPDRATPNRLTNPARTRPGVGSGWPPASPSSASICWSWVRAPGPVNAIGTPTKTSSCMSSGVRWCSSPMLAKLIDTGDCAGFKAGASDGHHLQNRGGATALILEVGTRGSGEPHAEYPDIDLRVGAA